MHIRRPTNVAAGICRMAPLFGWTSLPWLWAVRQPTLIVCGDDDPVTPPINHQVIASVMPHVQLHAVEGGGHLVLVDSPSRVAPVITNFLSA